MTNELNTNETRIRKKNENSLVKRSVPKTQRQRQRGVKTEHKSTKTTPETRSTRLSDVKEKSNLRNLRENKKITEKRLPPAVSAMSPKPSPQTSRRFCF